MPGYDTCRFLLLKTLADIAKWPSFKNEIQNAELASKATRWIMWVIRRAKLCFRLG